MIYFILSLFAFNVAMYAFFAINRRADQTAALNRLDTNHFLLVNLSEVLSSLVQIKGISDFYCLDERTPYNIYLSRSRYEVASYDKLLEQLSTERFSAPVRSKYEEIIERQNHSISTLRAEIKRAAKIEFPELVITQLSA